MNIEKLRNFEPLFGAWYVDGKVAQGRNSDVYRVRRTQNGKSDYLGLKTIRFPSSEKDFNRVMQSGKYKSSDEYLTALESKLRVNMEKMMQLRANKNIVRFDDYMIVKEFNYFHVIILMELLTPLADYLSAEKINTAEIAKMGIDLCSALSGFRHCGIMHREIKPENILVDSDGNYKLGDFGISRIGSDSDETEVSNYLAPEVLSGSGSDYCSDIYSLGILMYKFTNDNRMPFLPPFPAPISMADRQKAFERRMSGESLIKPSKADLAFSKIIFKAAAFKPEERYASPGQLSLAIESYLMPQPKPTSDEDATRVITPPERLYKTAGADDDLNFGKPPVSRANGEQSEFDEAFSDDDDEENENPTNKKVIALVVAIIIVLAVVAALLYKTYAPQKADVTTTTAEQTTQQATTEEITTPAPTTTEPTTETTTEEPTTTQAPTTTEAPTTTQEPTTTEEATEASQVPVMYTPSKHSNGEKNSQGKTYVDVEAQATKEVRDGQISKVIVNLDDMGNYPEKKGNAYICQVSNGNVLLKEPLEFNCLYDDSDPESGISLEFNIDNEIYDEDGIDYYMVFEQGAVESETEILLPFQIKV